MEIYNQISSTPPGTKCCGANSLSTDGTSLNDSHAEVLCRRGFLRYLYDQMFNYADDSSDSIFLFDNAIDKFVLKENISFHFYTTHAPCGDASIFPIQNTPAECENEGSSAKKAKIVNVEHAEIGDVDPASEISRMNFTGGKLIHSEFEVSGDRMYQSIGAIRTKPGRGDQTLSVSCSDKLAKWCLMGLQGTLISDLLMRPIHIHSITISNSSHCDVNALERALWGRFVSGDSTESFFHGHFELNKPKIQKCNQADFEFKQSLSLTPCPASIIWCEVSHRPHEVAIDGKRMGVTKKSVHSPSAWLLICKKELLKSYWRVKEKCKTNSNTKSEYLTYQSTKKLAKDYSEAWSTAKIQYFKSWTKKPNNLNQFK